MDDWWNIYENGNFDRLKSHLNSSTEDTSKLLIDLFLQFERGEIIQLPQHPELEANPYYHILQILLACDQKKYLDAKKWLVKLKKSLTKHPSLNDYSDFFQTELQFHDGNKNGALNNIREIEKRSSNIPILLKFLILNLKTEIYTSMLQAKEALNLVNSFQEISDEYPCSWKLKINLIKAHVLLSLKNYKLAYEIGLEVLESSIKNKNSRMIFKSSLFLGETSLIMGIVDDCRGFLSTSLSFSSKYATQEEIIKLYHLLTLNSILLGRYDYATIYQRMSWKLITPETKNELCLTSLYLQGLNMIMTNFGAIELLGKLENYENFKFQDLKRFFLLSLKMMGKLYTMDELQELTKIIHTSFLPQVFVILNLPILINELMDKFLTTPDLTMVYLTNTLSMINDLEETLISESSIFLKISVHLLKYRLYYMLRDSGVGDLHLALAKNFIQVYNLKFFENLLRLYLTPASDTEISQKIDIFQSFERDLDSIFKTVSLNRGPIAFIITTNDGLEIYRRFFQKDMNVFLGGWLTGLLFILQSMTEIELTKLEISDFSIFTKKKFGFYFWLIEYKNDLPETFQKFSEFVEDINISDVELGERSAFDMDVLSDVDVLLEKFCDGLQFSSEFRC